MGAKIKKSAYSVRYCITIIIKINVCVFWIRSHKNLKVAILITDISFHIVD